MYQLLIISFSRNISFVFNSLLFNLVATLLLKEYDSKPTRESFPRRNGFAAKL